jgi:hypothetical protein
MSANRFVPERLVFGIRLERLRHTGDGQSIKRPALGHDPGSKPVFRKDHAPPKSYSQIASI